MRMQTATCIALLQGVAPKPSVRGPSATTATAQHCLRATNLALQPTEEGVCTVRCRVSKQARERVRERVIQASALAFLLLLLLLTRCSTDAQEQKRENELQCARLHCHYVLATVSVQLSTIADYQWRGG